MVLSFAIMKTSEQVTFISADLSYQSVSNTDQYIKGAYMKLSTKLFTLGAGVLLSVSAFANDAIVGKWKMSEKGEEKAIITISQAGNGYQGVMTQGLTDKAKKREGTIVLTNISSQGEGKYKGKGAHPTLPIKGTVNITVNGNTITIKSIAGTQTGVRQ